MWKVPDGGRKSDESMFPTLAGKGVMKKHSETTIREAFRRVWRAAIGEPSKPGEKALMSIPVDEAADADCILMAALEELFELRKQNDCPDCHGQSVQNHPEFQCARCSESDVPDGWLIWDEDNGRIFVQHPHGVPPAEAKLKLQQAGLHVFGPVTFKDWKPCGRHESGL